MGVSSPLLRIHLGSSGLGAGHTQNPPAGFQNAVCDDDETEINGKVYRLGRLCKLTAGNIDSAILVGKGGTAKQNTQQRKSPCEGRGESSYLLCVRRLLLGGGWEQKGPRDPGLETEGGSVAPGRVQEFCLGERKDFSYSVPC